MEISFTTLFGHEPDCKLVTDYVADNLIDRMCNGQIESAGQSVQNIATAFGRLVELLADRGQLSAEEIGAITNSCDGELKLLPRDH